MKLSQTDLQIAELIDRELVRQRDGLELIPSENYASSAVREAMGSIFTNKYSEGYPRKRYYGGNMFVDQVEEVAQNRAKELFGVPHVNVQPYSGSPANLAVYMATCDPGDVIMGLNLPDGGHLTHGWKVSATGKWFRSIPYHVRPDGRVDLDEVRELAKKHRPKLIWAGATAYPYEYEYEAYGQIADEVGAYFAADIAHVAGLIIAGVHASPADHAHIITTTTHKTLRGPRGGMIMVTEKGLTKDPELAQKIDKAIFPGLQGGPHDHTTAAIAVALEEASRPEFKAYGAQVVKNAKALAAGLKSEGFTLVGDGTENHLLLIDLVPQFGPGGGAFAEYALEVAGMTANKNTIPADPSVPFYPSGLRLGTPAITTRGMGEGDMKRISSWIGRAIRIVSESKLPDTKEKRIEYMKSFKERVSKDKTLTSIAREIATFCADFPLP